jgi:hypothetical protein
VLPRDGTVIFTIFEGASEIQWVITGSDVGYPVDPGYRYYRGNLIEDRLPHRESGLLRRIEWSVRVPAL